MYAILLAIGLLAPPKLVVPLEALEHEPIEILSGVDVEEGWVPLHDWSISDGGQGREYEDGRVFAIWAKPGEYQITHKVFLANWEQQQLKKVSEVVTLIVRPRAPPTPPTPPPPGPGPRPDPETDLAKSVKAWAEELFDQEARTAAAQIAARYRDTAAALEDGSIPTIAAAIEQIRVGQFPSQNVKDKYTLLSSRINEVWRSKWPMERAEVVQFFRDVASGLEAL